LNKTSFLNFQQEKELNNRQYDIDDLDVQLQDAKEAKEKEACILQNPLIMFSFWKILCIALVWSQSKAERGVHRAKK
jgi:hypothetical protein